MGVEVSALPCYGKRPHVLEYWLRERFPELDFVCRRFKSRNDGLIYMSIKATVRGKPAQLRLHRHVQLDQLWRREGFDLLLIQLWLASPGR